MNVTSTCHIFIISFMLLRLLSKAEKKKETFSVLQRTAHIHSQFNRVLAVHRVLISVGCFTFPIDVVYANFSVFYSSVWFNEIPYNYDKKEWIVKWWIGT